MADRFNRAALVLLALLMLGVVVRAAYRDHRWNERCKAAGGIPVADAKCVRPGSFNEVPRG